MSYENMAGAEFHFGEVQKFKDEPSRSDSRWTLLTLLVLATWAILIVPVAIKVWGWAL